MRIDTFALLIIFVSGLDEFEDAVGACGALSSHYRT